MSSFKYHSPDDFFLNFICFHVLHNRASVSCRRPTHPSARYRSASAGILPLIIFFDWPFTFLRLVQPLEMSLQPLAKILVEALHNVRHKIWTVFMMLKTFSCADLFSRPLFWSIYWWIMWFLCGFEYIAKNHHWVYIATVTGICVGNQGNVREKSGNFFLPTLWQPWSCNHASMA